MTDVEARQEPEAHLGALIAAEGPDVGDEVLISLEQETARRTVAELPEPDRTVIRLRALRAAA